MRALILPVTLSLLLAACESGGKSFTPTCEAEEPSAEARLPAGPYADGGYLIIGGRRITPGGDQVTLGGFPMALLPLTDRFVAITDGAYGDEALRVFDLTTRAVVASDTLTSDEGAFYYGLALYHGTKLFAAGGGGAESNRVASAVYAYDFDPATGALGARRPIAVDGYPAGLALTADGSALVVARLRDNALSLIDPVGETVTGELKLTGSKFSFPFAVVTAPAGSGRNEAYVSLWGGTQIAIVDLGTSEITYVDVAKNPEGILVTPAGDKLIVANSDSDSITVVDLATRQATVSQTLGESADAPRGISPTALSLTPDGGRLLVTLTGDNAIDVLDATTLARVGRIPTGWYPTAALWHPTAGVLVLNAKGVGAGSNVDPQNPTVAADWLSGIDLMRGTISIVPEPSDDDLTAGRTQVTANNGRPQAVAAKLTCTGSTRRFPLPEKVGDPTPIEHVVLIVRENKTFDAILGDLEGANGQADLAMWGEEVTPNLHALARQFTILDNFYSNAEQSLQGHQWTAADNSNDFSEKTWLTTWGRGTHDISDFKTPAVGPEHGYIWQQLDALQFDYVNMGEVIGIDAHTNIDVKYPGLYFNLDTLDVDKADYVADLIKREGLPHFTYIGLPNDHTQATTPGKQTPESMIADNDEGTGRIIEALSQSPLWEKTVVFVIEDDPQDGADHVEAHRSPCLVVGPWVKHAHVSSAHYDNPSLWHTLTLLLGIAPLSRYDATAAPMFDVWGHRPDLAPYTHIPRKVKSQTNSIGAFGAAESAQMDFSKPDAARGLQELLWRYRMRTEPPWRPLPRPRDDDDD